MGDTSRSEEPNFCAGQRRAIAMPRRTYENIRGKKRTIAGNTREIRTTGRSRPKIGGAGRTSEGAKAIRSCSGRPKLCAWQASSSQGPILAVRITLKLRNRYEVARKPLFVTRPLRVTDRAGQRPRRTALFAPSLPLPKELKSRASKSSPPQAEASDQRARKGPRTFFGVQGSIGGR
eukprot:scaffold2136_cov242-Pinguiococcus_pyrenoidosus.AAC.7